jgi:hypothetical protein
VSFRRAVVVLLALAALAGALGLATARGAAVPHTPRRGVPPPCAPGEATRLDAPMPGTAYHTAYFSPTPDEVTVTDATIEAFESLTGEQLAGVYFSDHWGRNRRVTIRFPQRKVDTIWAHGAVPIVRMMPWMLWHVRDNPITLQRILDGRYDGALRAWFREARDAGIPLVVDFGVEVNGRWFPWNGLWNGGGRTDRFGDPHEPDGPERFVHAYRRLVRLAREVGADDLTWMFHVDANSWPDVRWNRPGRYYPGDAYVDWITLSSYGLQVPTGRPRDWQAFRDNLGNPGNAASPYARIREIDPDAPFGVIELGVAEDPHAGDKAEWIADAYRDVTPPGARYEAELVSYWSEKWRNGDGTVSDLRVSSSPEALQAFRDAIDDPAFVSTPRWVCS